MLRIYDFLENILQNITKFDIIFTYIRLMERMVLMKKLICCITVLVMVLSAFGGAAYAADSDGFVTRAEFAGAVAEALRSKGIYGGINSVTEEFADDGSEDVMMLKKLSLIMGDGDDCFRPDDNILFEEAAAILGRVFLPEDVIFEKYGAFPNGHIMLVMEKGLLTGAGSMIKGTPVTEETLSKLTANLSESLVTYDVMERLGCSWYNGDVYIDYYPKSWQGYEATAAAQADGYRDGYYYHYLPSKLLYSYDRENWNVAYEDIEGERVCYNLPDHIKNIKYLDFNGAIRGTTDDPNNSYYTYDFKTWTQGEPELQYNEKKTDRNSFTMCLEPVCSDVEAGLFFSYYPYENQELTSGKTVFNEPKHSLIWASKDAVSWIPIRVPEGAKYFTSAAIDTRAKALFIDCAVEFSDEEKTYLENEKKTADELNLDYIIKPYKTERYMLTFDEVNKLIESIS